MQQWRLVTLGMGLMAALGCEEKQSAMAPMPAAEPATAQPLAAAPTPIPPPANGQVGNQGTVAQANAKAVFAQRCTLCHGTDGRGTGPAAANLNPKPRDYSDAKWQASVQDDYLAKVIVEGGAAVGKSMMMPPNPDLKDKPEQVAELVKIVRSFKK